jgi:hypothetical protein
MRTVVVIAGMVALGCIGAQAQGWWPFSRGPSNYDECMLAEMKGQNSSMWATVDKVCSRRFKREVSMYLPKEELEFTLKAYTAIITFKSKEYDVTRLKVRFAKKPCEDAKSEEDWGKFEEVLVTGGQAIARVGSFGDTFTETCMLWKDVYGTYK